MWYLLGLGCVLALLASPLTASAQEAAEGTSLEPKTEEAAAPSEPVPAEGLPSSESVSEQPLPSPESAPEEPALQLKLDEAGVEVVPSQPRTRRGYTVEEMHRRVKRADLGFYLSIPPTVVGWLVAGGAWLAGIDFEPRTAEEQAEEEAKKRRFIIAGATVGAAGTASLLAMGIVMGVRKKQRRELLRAHYDAPRRVQWDLARSRLVF